MWESQFLVLASGTALMADQLRAQILDWSRYPTLTSLESMSVPVEEAPFPAVTVCQGRDFLHFFNFMEFLLHPFLFAIGCRKEPLWPPEALGTLGNFWSGSPRENMSKTPTEGSCFYFFPTSQLEKTFIVRNEFFSSELGERLSLVLRESAEVFKERMLLLLESSDFQGLEGHLETRRPTISNSNRLFNRFISASRSLLCTSAGGLMGDQEFSSLTVDNFMRLPPSLFIKKMENEVEAR